MNNRKLHFWLIFIASIIISALIISVLVKAMKLILMGILVLALTPVVYLILKKLLLPQKKDDSDKLKTRH
ncbi:hypothetical protein ACXYMU_00535 [Pontibacter sp. CAU 1760]